MLGVVSYPQGRCCGAHGEGQGPLQGLMPWAGLAEKWTQVVESELTVLAPGNGSWTMACLSPRQLLLQPSPSQPWGNRGPEDGPQRQPVKGTETA